MPALKHSVVHYAFEAPGCQLGKASVFNSNLVDNVMLSVVTEPDITEDRFYNDFSKMLGYLYDDIVGLEGASGLRSDQPCRRRVSKGDEFNKAVPALPAPAAPAPAAWENGASHAHKPPTPHLSIQEPGMSNFEHA